VALSTVRPADGPTSGVDVPEEPLSTTVFAAPDTNVTSESRLSAGENVSLGVVMVSAGGSCNKLMWKNILKSQLGIKEVEYWNYLTLFQYSSYSFFFLYK
jgi:hypothetical protein